MGKAEEGRKGSHSHEDSQEGKPGGAGGHEGQRRDTRGLIPLHCGPEQEDTPAC